MIRLFNKILDDFKNGENIENYIIIALVIIIVLLDIFDFGNGAWTTEVTLAILALLAYGRINDLRKLKQIDEKLASAVRSPIMEEYPEFTKQIGNAVGARYL